MPGQILVCIDGHPKGHLLINAAHRKARDSNLPWQVIVLRDHDADDSTIVQHSLARLVQKARRSGADIQYIDHSLGLFDYIDTRIQAGEKIRHIFIGQRHSAGRGLFARASLAERLTARFGRQAEVTIIPLEGQVESRNFRERLGLEPLAKQVVLAPFIAVIAAFLTAEIVRSLLPTILFRINTMNIALIFLLACVVVALRYGALAGLIAAFLSVGTLNYVYIVPIYQFNIDDATDVISLLIFSSTAILIAILGGRTRAGMNATRRRNEQIKALYEVNALAAEAENQHQLMEIMERELSKLLRMDVGFFVVTDAGAWEEEEISAPVHEVEAEVSGMDGQDSMPAFDQYPANATMNDVDLRALKKCWQTNLPSGFGTLRGIGASWYFEIISTVRCPYGVLGVKVPLNARLDADFSQLLSALADHVAAALERLAALTGLQESRFREEREKLRSMLLSSVSHDLKTPLASVIGSMSVLKTLRKSGRLTDQQLDTLADTALDEAQRLDSFITNILSMTRLESGDIEVEPERNDPSEPLGWALKALRTRLRGREIETNNEAGSVTVMMDSLLTGQVLQNLIDNAAKYSPEGTTITVSQVVEGDYFYYRVRDRGEGIPPSDLERIFDKYERLTKTDSQVAGTGLGLAIARTIMKAQNGAIWAENNPEGGAEFVLRLPLAKDEPGGQETLIEMEEQRYA